MKRTTFLLILACLTLSACATPTTRYPQATAHTVAKSPTASVLNEAAQRYKAQTLLWARAYKVSYPILLGTVDSCQEKQYSNGFFLSSRTLFHGEEERAAAIKAFNLGQNQKIIALPESSKLYKQGAREGDEFYPGVLQANTTVISSPNGQGKIIPTVSSPPICNIPIQIIPGESPNAYADKGTIYINEGMMRFTNDEELAQVISHELAHVLMAHTDAKNWNTFLGTITGFTFDIFAAAAGVNTQMAGTRAGYDSGGVYASQDFEREADYVGLYLMAKGGYDITRAPDFWKRMAKLYPQSAEPSLVSTHPSSAERYNSMGIAVAEINKKKVLGMALEPEKKK